MTHNAANNLSTKKVTTIYSNGAENQKRTFVVQTFLYQRCIRIID